MGIIRGREHLPATQQAVPLDNITVHIIDPRGKGRRWWREGQRVCPVQMQEGRPGEVHHSVRTQEEEAVEHACRGGAWQVGGAYLKGPALCLRNESTGYTVCACVQKDSSVQSNSM